MSINHYDLSQPPPQWWSHHSLSSNAVAIDLNHDDECEQHQRQSEPIVPKDRLFEKPLTPSDVGKLNRLVIPKQHAEKHFPLNGGKEPGENGMLLGFEDEIGKPWRFRYSYWNSSQSYVLTKGWSRFVKEKRLDAGDVVVFARHRIEPGRFFIGWRRGATGGGEVSRPGQHYPYPSQYRHSALRPSPSSLPYQPDESICAVVQEEKQTTTRGSAGSSKWLRLFGVNLECHQTVDESDSSTLVGSPGSSRGKAHRRQYYYSNNEMEF